jgi:prepilin-type N-terminal cleavage/methylation domain-containing protein
MATEHWKSAFTLVEVLVSVALTGLIASLAFAPVAYAVRQVTETEEAYYDELDLRRTAMFMAQDVAAGLRLASVTVRVIGHKELGGGDNDTLIVAGSAQARQNLAAGSVVYRVVRWSFMNDKYVSGLYRWLLPGVLPEDVEYEKLEVKDGQLITPYVTELSLSVFESPEWVSDYGGKLPTGMKFVLSRERNAGKGERVEYVAGFPN